MMYEPTRAQEQACEALALEHESVRVIGPLSAALPSLLIVEARDGARFTPYVIAPNGRLVPDRA